MGSDHRGEGFDDGFSVLVPVQRPAAGAEATGDLPADPERTQAQLDLWRRLERQGGRAESADESIRVSVDAAGRVDSIWLDPRLALAMDELASRLAEACCEAFDNRLTEIARLVEESAAVLEPHLAIQVETMTRHLRRPRQ